MLKILEGMVLLFLLGQFFHTLYVYKLKINVYWCAYYVFVVFFILPDLVFLINGTLTLNVPGYHLIKFDTLVDWIYLAYAAIAGNILRRIAIRRTNAGLIELRGIEFELPKAAWYACLGLTLIPTIMALLAPQPELYFCSFLPFYRKSVYAVSDAASAWHGSVMTNLLVVGFIGVLVCWIKTAGGKTDKKTKWLRVYLAVIALQILLFSNKRTFGMLVIMVLILVDVIYKDKTPWLELLGGGAFCIVYFVFYQVITGKTVGGRQSAPVEVYSMYFSRVLDFKFVIYSLLHPDTVQILDYPGQSLLFDVLFFVPRAIWPGKPLPFGSYYTAAWTGQIVENVTSRYLTSWFAEAVANLSWLGFPVGMWLYVKMMDVFAKFKNPIVNVFALYVSIYIMVTQFGSNHKNIAILALLLIVLENRTIRQMWTPFAKKMGRKFRGLRKK